MHVFYRIAGLVQLLPSNCRQTGRGLINVHLQDSSRCCSFLHIATAVEGCLLTH